MKILLICSKPIITSSDTDDPDCNTDYAWKQEDGKSAAAIKDVESISENAIVEAPAKVNDGDEYDIDLPISENSNEIQRNQEDSEYSHHTLR